MTDLPESSQTSSARLRIALIGPMPPFRGGISQYNALLANALSDVGHEVHVFSFSRRYPIWLYPGNVGNSVTSQVTKQVVRETIDYLNPFSWRATVRAIVLLKPSQVICHWWTVFWAPAIATIMWMLRRHGIRVTLICHNVADHDSSPVSAWISGHVVQMADGYLVHSRKLLAMMQASDGAKVSVQHPIPAYSDYPTAEGLLPKRGRLELLFFGYIRPYKGLDVLLDALEQLRDPDVYLTIAGELWGKARRRLVQAAVNPRIDAHLGYVNDAEAAELFERADYVVLPYRSATGSAVAALALNYRKPMIASRIGGLPDVVIDGYTGILVPPSDATALANAISLTNRNEAAKLADGVRDFTLQYGWRSLCDTLVRLA